MFNVRCSVFPLHFLLPPACHAEIPDERRGVEFPVLRPNTQSGAAAGSPGHPWPAPSTMTRTPAKPVGRPPVRLCPHPGPVLQRSGSATDSGAGSAPTLPPNSVPCRAPTAPVHRWHCSLRRRPRAPRIRRAVDQQERRHRSGRPAAGQGLRQPGADAGRAASSPGAPGPAAGPSSPVGVPGRIHPFRIHGVSPATAWTRRRRKPTSSTPARSAGVVPGRRPRWRSPRRERPPRNPRWRPASIIRWSRSSRSRSPRCRAGPEPAAPPLRSAVAAPPHWNVRCRPATPGRLPAGRIAQPAERRSPHPAPRNAASRSTPEHRRLITGLDIARIVRLFMAGDKRPAVVKLLPYSIE